MDSFYDDFRLNIKYYRNVQHLSQASLAELSNCSNGMIGLIEAGKTKPSFETIVSISKALKIHPADLFLRDTSKSKAEIKKIIENTLIDDIKALLDKTFPCL